MGRVYQPKPKCYTPEDLQEALRLIQAGELSIRAAAKRFNIDMNLLSRRNRGINQTKQGRKTSIPFSVEPIPVEKVKRIPVEKVQPAHPLPTADISPAAVQPTRLRVYKKRPVVPRYEDVTQIVSQIKRTEVHKRKERCRLCMGESRIPMLSITKSPPINKVSLALKIFSVVGVSIVGGDGMPDLICQPCNKSIINWYDFKQVCLTSDAKYRKQVTRRIAKGQSSTQANSSDDSDTEAAPPPRPRRSCTFVASEEPVEVKLEIEEHNVFETSGYNYQHEDNTTDETTPPAFVNVKVEPPDHDTMWNPEVSLSSTDRSVDTSQLPGGECKVEFTDSGVDRDGETPLTDPLSIPTADNLVASPPRTTRPSNPLISVRNLACVSSNKPKDPVDNLVASSPLTTGPPQPLISVRNLPSTSSNKPTSYLLAVKPVSAPSDELPTYVLAINHPTASTDGSVFPSDMSNVANLPVITNVSVPLNTQPNSGTLSHPVKRDGDPLEESGGGKKSKSGPGVD